MTRKTAHVSLLGLLAALSVANAQAATASDWRALDPENVLVIDSTAGRIVVEMRPDLAPKAVERIRLLAREHVYDGLLFHRVIDRFVDQTGNPNNKDGGVSVHPDLEPEFDGRIAPANIASSSHPAGAVTGFLGALPVEASTRIGADGKARTWGLYCSGVAGMGRQKGWGTANSEIFFMRDPARRLDRDYTVWGRVVTGLDVVRKIKVGFPPKDPDKMTTVRVLSDIPASERPVIEVMAGPALAALIAKARIAKGANFTPCDIDVPARTSGAKGSR
jgi:peptidylprolyl isomerase